MRRNFEITWNSPQVLVRAALGLLLLGNLIAAGFAFHLWDDSPQALGRKLQATRANIAAQRNRLSQSKVISAKMDQARTQGGSFIDTYMTPRKSTYSTILGELNAIAAEASVKYREGTISREPVEGSDSLSMLTVTATCEAAYPSLLKFVNLLDKSKRFMIIESLQVAPQPQTANLNITIKLNTFVRDDVEDQS
jgi:hypothetical protein